MCAIMSALIAVVIIICLLSLSLLVFSLDVALVADAGVVAKISRVITSFLMVPITLGLVKLTMSYNKFGKSAAKSAAAANALLEKSTIKNEQAIVVAYEYFIARASSPVLPTALWKLWKDRLNGLYPYKNKTAPASRAT